MLLNSQKGSLMIGVRSSENNSKAVWEVVKNQSGNNVSNIKNISLWHKGNLIDELNKVTS